MIHQVTNIIPNIGNEEMKRYGNTAKKVDGAKIVIKLLQNQPNIYLLFKINAT